MNCPKCKMPSHGTGIDQCYCETADDLFEIPKKGLNKELGISIPNIRGCLQEVVSGPNWIPAVETTSQLPFDVGECTACFVEVEDRSFVFLGGSWYSMSRHNATI